MHSLRTRAAGTHPSQPTTGEGGQRVDRRAALRTVLEGEGEGGGGRGGTLDMADVSTSTKRQHAELGLQPEETASSFVSCAAAAACSPSLPPATTLTLSMTACLLASPCFCFPPTTPHSCLSASSLPPPPARATVHPPLQAPVLLPHRRRNGHRAPARHHPHGYAGGQLQRDLQAADTSGNAAGTAVRDPGGRTHRGRGRGVQGHQLSSRRGVQGC